MNTYDQYPSYLFTLRLWKEPLGEGQVELRFQVQHVLTGENRIFRDEAQLVAYLRAKIEEAEDTEEA
jgi:hypothetical protein